MLPVSIPLMGWMHGTETGSTQWTLGFSSVLIWASTCHEDILEFRMCTQRLSDSHSLSLSRFSTPKQFVTSRYNYNVEISPVWWSGLGGASGRYLRSVPTCLKSESGDWSGMSQSRTHRQSKGCPKHHISCISSMPQRFRCSTLRRYWFTLFATKLCGRVWC